MRLSIISSLMLLQFFLALASHGALPKLRPYTGSGLLLMRTPAPREPDTPATLIFYREPGIGRVVERGYGDIPLLSQIVEFPPGEYPAAVMGKKGAWLKIAYDEAGRAGWIEEMRRWDYVSWEEFLPGRTARFLPWLKKGHYLLRGGPSASARELITLAAESAVRIDLVEGDWMRVTVAPLTEGWLRWRDEEGRFLITVRPGRVP
jgi:hypothetical protein